MDKCFVCEKPVAPQHAHAQKLIWGEKTKLGCWDHIGIFRKEIISALIMIALAFQALYDKESGE